MESFVLAETFKYLYMIFSEPNDLPFHPDNYVLTTEAHFLPLSIAEMTGTDPNDRVKENIFRGITFCILYYFLASSSNAY